MWIKLSRVPFRQRASVLLFNFGNCRRERVRISNLNLLQECVLFETASFHVFARVVLLHALVIIFKTNIVSNSNWVYLNMPCLCRNFTRQKDFKPPTMARLDLQILMNLMTAFPQLCFCLEISWRRFFSLTQRQSEGDTKHSRPC